MKKASLSVGGRGVRAGAACAGVLAGGASVWAGLDERLAAGPLRLDTSAAYAGRIADQPAVPAGGENAAGASGGYGLPGGWWITFGGGYANDFGDEQDLNAHVAFSTFLADELEFSVELAGWYFDQVGTDTGGINPGMVFRWHFWHADNFDWTVYGDVGIGLLFSFDDVPDGGTSFNFTPRAGLGYTTRIDDDGTRLQLGVRYHHVSNARIEGDGRNPSRDSVMVYAGVVFPF